MEHQDLINWILGLFGTIIGFMVKSVWGSVKELQNNDKDLIDRVHSIETLVAGEYVKKDEMTQHVIAMFKKLDRIESKLDSKMDKYNGSNKT